jgi:hypothetical protein
MTFKIAATWFSDPTGVRAPELAATWGSCEISADDRTITLVEDSITGLSRRYIVGSLYPLAEWIVYNWWALQWDYRASDFVKHSFGGSVRNGPSELYRTHNVSQAGDGFAWPSLWIAPTDSGTLLRWDSGNGNGRVKFLSSGFAKAHTEELMATLARFVDQVVDRLAQEGIDDTPLNKEWEAVLGADADEAEFYRSAASLGLDPFEVDPEVSDAMIKAHELLGPQDFDVLMSSAEPSRLVADIEWIKNAEASRADLARSNAAAIDELRTRRVWTISPHSTAPWKAGYDAATEVRLLMKVSVDERIELDPYVPVSYLEAPDPGLVAVAHLWRGYSAVVLGGKRGFASQRFVQARSIWRFINQRSDSKRILIGHGHTAFQQAERAFAAELLAPAEAIRYQLDERLGDSEVIAEKFGVSVTVIDNQIENRLARY